MKLTIINHLNEEGNDRGLEIKLNDKRRFYIGEGEPEDMVLWRDLSDAYNVEQMLKDAHKAGAAGEPLLIEHLEEEC